MAGEKNEKSVEVTLEQVKGLIQEATQGLAPKDQLKAILEEAGIVIITEDRVREILEEFKMESHLSYAEGIQLGPLESEKAGKPLLPIDPKWLKGLIFRDAERKEVKEDGEKKVKYFPIERALEPADVLTWTDNGATITFVTADGQKYTVDKNPKKGE